jgi:hypothetical protein
LVGYAWAAGGTKQLAYFGRDNPRHIHELYVGLDRPWGYADLMAGTDARTTGVDPTVLSGYDWTVGGTKQIVYDCAWICELYAGSAGWSFTNLSYLLWQEGPPEPGWRKRALVGFDWPARGSKQIAYLDDAGHVHELSVVSGGNWSHADLTAMTSAPLNTGKQLTGFSWSAGNAKQVAYLDDAGHIHELSVVLGGNWSHADLTAMTGAAPVGGLATGGLSVVGFDWPARGSKQIAYLDDAGHVHELSVVSGGNWSHADLSALTGAPLAWTSG